MNKRLFLCEKPDQGRMIATNLGGGERSMGYIEGDDWIVTWCVGHLMTPCMPEDYDPDFKEWKWDNLPIIPQKFKFKPKDGGAVKQISVIRAQMKKAKELIISTDADREGEFIAYEIINELKWTGPTYRLWLSDLTPAAINKAIANLRDSEETRPLYWAAAARTYADWIVGMNMTRAVTLKMRSMSYGSKALSIGRVQTPVLALIVDLERKIANFKPEAYFELSAIVTTPSGKVKMRHAPDEKNRIKTRKDAEDLARQAIDKTSPVQVTSEIRKEAPPALHDLLSLQQDANSILGWSANKALEIAQSLYEKRQALTYPRTDCRYLPETHKPGISSILKNLESVPGVEDLAKKMSNPVVRQSVYNDKKITAHHAIIPTLKSPDLIEMSEDERSLYMIVARRWMANHMDDHTYLETKMQTEPGGVTFRTSGRITKDPGWKSVYASAQKEEKEEDENNDEENQNQSLPPIRNGEPGKPNPVDIVEKTTKAPTRFTERTLLGAMENISRFVDDAGAKKILSDTKGIGTPATRSNIIETLKIRDYIQTKKKQIIPTDIAINMIDGVRKIAPLYADPVMTAQWEKILDLIAGDREPKLNGKFVRGIAERVKGDVENIQKADISRIEGAQGPGGDKNKKSGRPPASAAGRIEGDWKTAIKEGIPINVSFEKKDDAKALGARFDGDRKIWVVPKGIDIKPFIDAGFKKKS